MENTDYQKIVVGLDVGTTKICAIVGRLNEFEKLEILGMGEAKSEGVSKGTVVNIDKTVTAIKKAITEAGNKAGVDIQVVNVGIAGQHIKSAVHHGSITRASVENEISVEDVQRLTDDMYKIVVPPGSKIIHVMPQTFTVDYEGEIKEPVGMSGIKLGADFHIITAQTGPINNIYRCVTRNGIEVNNMVLEPLASSLAVLSEEEKEAGVCLIDIGGGTTDIAIFYDRIIRHTSVIPLGGNIITKDIQEGLRVMLYQAEELKIRFGKAISDEASHNEIVSVPGIRGRSTTEISVKNLANIIQSRMEEIIAMAHSEIINSGYEKKLAGGIVLTGGGATLSCIRQLVEYMTGLNTRIGYPNEHLGKNQAGFSRADDVKSPMYATAVGLVLAGFKSLDEREERYKIDKYSTKEIQSSSPKEIQQKKKNSNPGQGIISFFTGKIKGILMDDLNDKNEY